jgi:hypothetical protein
MPSVAYNQHLVVLLEDGDQLLDAHEELRTGRRGRQWGLEALNRAAVVMCVSAWQAYLQELVLEALAALQPAAPAPLGTWPTLNANARSLIGRFNTPSVGNVRRLFTEALGAPDVTNAWAWQNCGVDRASSLLEKALRFRHQIAHGVNPRPVIHNQYASGLPGFFLRLGSCTDRAVREYLVRDLALPSPWPL